MSSPGSSIPDRHPGGVTDTIALGPNATINGVKVTLDIAHTYRGDLRVTLLAPWGGSRERWLRRSAMELRGRSRLG